MRRWSAATFYEVVSTRGGVRLLIGDVRGKWLGAVRLTTVVLGFFRTAAVEAESLAEVARQLDCRLLPYLEDEDFALLAAEYSPTSSPS
ncbi:MAG: SpoIIE family protein phosphatase [Nocardioidaceae bacterium]